MGGKMKTLYHGTSSEKVDLILNEGLKSPYLTNHLGLARYYASESVYECGGKPVLLRVRVDKNNLRVDFHSLEEPVGFGGKTSDRIEEKVDRMYSRVEKVHPEWVKDDYIDIPEHEYDISLKTVGACRYDGIILPTNIRILE
jgi:hypothetical protein